MRIPVEPSALGPVPSSMAALRCSAHSGNALREGRHGLGDRNRGGQALADPFQVALRGAKLLDESLGVSLRARLVCFPQFILGVIAESRGCLRQVAYLLLKTLEHLKHLGQVLRSR